MSSAQRSDGERARTSTGPTTRRRQLGATLSSLRDRKGLTLEEAGRLVGVSKATVSRYETKEGPVKWLVIEALCREYGATDAERPAMVGLAKDAKLQGWWHSISDVVPEWMNLLLTLEEEAVSEDHYASVYVPGLLQTRRYAEAVHHASEIRLEHEVLDRLVDIRMKRQEILTRTAPLHIWAVLDEAVILRVVGDREVMAEQLDHLVHCVESPNITLQILPFSSGAHAAAVGSVALLRGADPTLDVVYIDILTGALFQEKPQELERYRLAIDYLRAQALDISASVALIKKMRKEI
ncbi:helix-turn-helix domain-containing protein [Streptomyces sp. RKAG337]|uniref:helix-turn-helix domain-containing protein n=1 Tax=Streptomyces sp. RKAG337 TaxID=2893404 RepID=UPI002034686A|nr:helix-turn-helix transcriptional regulator [Streptomyces sp. RKAG337]MCM2427672.1 helix-turn-helix domain-containing protein [Streptomyces sp. RKAG337]